MNIKEMILKDNVKSDTIRLTSLCITNNKKKDNKVYVAGIINDTKTQKEKTLLSKSHASICQRYWRHLLLYRV